MAWCVKRVLGILRVLWVSRRQSEGRPVYIRNTVVDLDAQFRHGKYNDSFCEVEITEDYEDNAECHH